MCNIRIGTTSPSAKLDIQPSNQELERRKNEIREFSQKLRDWGYTFTIEKIECKTTEYYGSGNVGIGTC
jgi:hypothetical protein